MRRSRCIYDCTGMYTESNSLKKSAATNYSNDRHWSGIGTDGQVLVYHDVLGYGVERVAKFVKQFGTVDELMINSLKALCKRSKIKRISG